MPHPAAAYQQRPATYRAHPTRRQLAILTAVANGNTSAAVARQFGISRNTVLGQLHQIYRKLGARDRAHAVALALVRGLIRPEDIRPAGDPQRPPGLVPEAPARPVLRGRRIRTVPLSGDLL